MLLQSTKCNVLYIVTTLLYWTYFIAQRWRHCIGFYRYLTASAPVSQYRARGTSFATIVQVTHQAILSPTITLRKIIFTSEHGVDLFIAWERLNKSQVESSIYMKLNFPMPRASIQIYIRHEWCGDPGDRIHCVQQGAPACIVSQTFGGTVPFLHLLAWRTTVAQHSWDRLWDPFPRHFVTPWKV